MTKAGKYLCSLLALSIAGGACFLLAFSGEEETVDLSESIIVTNSTGSRLYVRVVYLNPKISADVPSQNVPNKENIGGLLSAYETRDFKLSLQGYSSISLLVAYAQTVPVDGSETKYSMQFFTSPLHPEYNIEQLQLENKIAIEFRPAQLRSLNEIMKLCTESGIQ